jgi:hypothetical protein
MRPSRSSVLQEPAANRNGFAVLHVVAALLVQFAASTLLSSALRDGAAIGAASFTEDST